MNLEQQESIYQEFVLCLKADFPTFELRNKKDVWFMKAINIFLLTVTFGRFSGFMDNFITTIGNAVYVSSHWDKMTSASKYVVLRHERTHMRQSKRHGRFLYSFLYLFGYLPAGWCVWRARFEQEAYEETVKAAALVYGCDYVKTAAFRGRIINMFLGPEYLWMYPFPESIEKWFDGVLNRI